jgi:hypothetical protein
MPSLTLMFQAATEKRWPPDTFEASLDYWNIMLRATLVTTAICAAALSAPAAAHADRETFDDHRRDVVHRVFADDGSVTATPVPRNRATDIINTTVRHGCYQVRVTVQKRVLREAACRAIDVRIKTDDGSVYYAQMLQDAEIRLFLNDSEGNSVTCHRMRSHDDPPSNQDHHFATALVPRQPRVDPRRGLGVSVLAPDAAGLGRRRAHRTDVVDPAAWHPRAAPERRLSRTSSATGG